MFDIEESFVKCVGKKIASVGVSYVDNDFGEIIFLFDDGTMASVNGWYNGTCKNDTGVFFEWVRGSETEYGTPIEEFEWFG